MIAHHLEGGIDLKDAWGCSISANTFTLAHQFSVRVGKDSGRLTISANNFCNTYIGGKDKRPAQDKTPMIIAIGLILILVVLFFRRLHTLVDIQLSDVDGYVQFDNLMPGGQAYYAIAFDPEGAPLQNAVIWDRLSPEPGP